MGKALGYTEESVGFHEESAMGPELAAGEKASLIQKSLLILNFSHYYSRIQSQKQVGKAPAVLVMHSLRVGAATGTSERLLVCVM